MTINTESWTAMMTGMIDYLLGFQTLDGGTVADTLGDRFYAGAAPDNVQGPIYAESRFINWDTTPGATMNRVTFFMEIFIFGRPRDTQAKNVELTADRICAALKLFKDATSGLIYCPGLKRDTLPPFTDPADRRVHQSRILAKMFVYPRLLTMYSVPSTITLYPRINLFPGPTLFPHD